MIIITLVDMHAVGWHECRGVPAVPRAGKNRTFSTIGRILAGVLPAVTGVLGLILRRVPAERQEKNEYGSCHRGKKTSRFAWVSCPFGVIHCFQVLR